MKIFEKNMTFNQQLGMITLKNTLNLFVDYSINFQLITRETEDCIIKEITSFPSIDMVDAKGEMYMQWVTDIEFRLHKNKETTIRFYTFYDEILEVDCFDGFDKIVATLID